MAKTATKTPRLVKCTYFISPIFVKKHKNQRTRYNDDTGGDDILWDVEWDTKDDFNNWLVENTVGGFSDMNIMEHNRRHYLFMGENGVMCQMATETFQHDTAKRIAWSDAWTGGYLNVVCVRSMPAGRELPEELLAELKSRNYKEGFKGLSREVMKQIGYRFKEAE